ncbi:MAG: hypothetical protein LBP50_04885, partial [Tannerella sp.]|nr:hypothetical protein [Tannerella sp.]
NCDPLISRRKSIKNNKFGVSFRVARSIGSMPAKRLNRRCRQGIGVDMDGGVAVDGIRPFHGDSLPGGFAAEEEENPAAA